MSSKNADENGVARQKNEKFMTLLKRHRMAEGLTMIELARKVGVTAAAVQAWESGRWEPKAKHVPKLAKALGITPMQLTRVISPDPDDNAPRPAAAVA